MYQCESPGITYPFVRSGSFAKDLVLVESDEILVLQDLDIGLAQLGDIRPDEKWRFHHRPKSEMGSALFSREVAVTYVEHVGIVVAAKVTIIAEEGVHIQDASDTAPVR